MYDDLIKRLREASKMSEALAVLLPNSDGSATAKLYNEAADAIEKLSSAGSIYGKAWTLGYDAGRDENMPSWIPVTERLPKEYSLVLLYSYGDVVVGSYDSECKEFIELNGFHRLCTHWMLLPEPPKEEA